MTYQGLIAKEEREGKKMPSLINQNTASRSRSDEKRYVWSDAQEGFSDVTFGITLKRNAGSRQSCLVMHTAFLSPSELKLDK